MTSTDAVIVAADSELVMGCIASLGGDSVASVTFVDNASTDGSSDAVRSRHPEVDVVRFETSVGYSEACNAGAAQGTAEFVLFLNDDIVAENGTVGTLLSALQSNPGAVAAGGRLVDPQTLETQTQYKPQRIPTLSRFAVQLIGLERLWPSNPISRRHSGAELDDRTVTGVDQPAGACLLLRRSAFAQIGGFDERYWFWYEDVDIAVRLLDLGTILYVPDAVFRHIGSARLGVWSRAARVRTRFTGLFRYSASHLSRSRRMALAAVVVMVSLPRVAVFSLVRREEGRAWRAVIAGAIQLARGRAVSLR